MPESWLDLGRSQISDGSTTTSTDLFDGGNTIFIATDSTQVAIAMDAAGEDYSVGSSHVADSASLRRLIYGTSEYNASSGRGASRAHRAWR